MSQIKVTKKQRVMLDYIESFTDNQGFSPSYREIAEALGYKSIATVAEHINNLVVAGLIRKNDGVARSLEVAKIDSSTHPLSLEQQINIRWHQLDELERQVVARAFKILKIAELEDMIK